MNPSQRTGVLVVGGGLVGLTAGLLLQQLGVPFVLVEKRAHASRLPRARGIHVRTMEIFRQLGVEDAVVAATKSAWAMGQFGGARRGRTMLESTVLPLDSIQKKLTGGDASPSSFGACPQTIIEPILRAQLEARGGDVRFGRELVAFRDRGDAIEAVVRDKQGVETPLVASYLLGADGGKSFVRAQLGIDATTTPADKHYLNLYFCADLAERVRGRTFSQCEVANERVRGLFSSKNNTDEWTFHLEHDPSAAIPSDVELVESIQAAIGATDVPVALLGKSAWNTAVRIADRYRVGRAFLAGDAAHLMPPWGGFNATTGIADVHNLAWKLAAAIDGTTAILDTYEAERRPVAVRNGVQARLRSDFDARFGIETPSNHDAFVQQRDPGALHLRVQYAPEPGIVDRAQAQLGTRFPHAWLTQHGARRSTLDLFGTAYVTLVGPRAAKMPGALVAGTDFTLEDIDWTTLTGLPDDGAVRVRPDGFVASRSDDAGRQG